MSADAGLATESLDLWRGDVWLVRQLGFAAGGGDLVHVRGPNGSGKTTLLRALAGLTRPESGSITWRGRALDADLIAYHRELAWLGHRDGLKPELTPVENLKAYRRLGGGQTGDIGAALEHAGLAGREQLPVRVLSAGQKRRVALARVFSSQARVWILDEPFANLDADGQRWGTQQLADHVRDGGIVILSTHLELGIGPAQRIELGGR